MIDLFVVKGETGKVALIKYTDEVSVMPVWKTRLSALEFLKREKWGKECIVEDFSFSDFEVSSSWAKKSGIRLFLYLLE